MFEAATSVILNILLENEEVKKFPQDFVTASMKWIRSWFLTDDDALGNSVLESAGNEPLKKMVVEQKLTGLIENETFKQELKTLLDAYSTEKTKVKNLVENANIEVDGSVRIGDQGTSGGDDYDQRNIVRGSTIKAGGDFRLGDDIVQAGGNIHYGDIHYHNTPTPQGGSGNAPAPAELARSLRSLIASGRTAEAVTKMTDHAERNNSEFLDEILQLSARWESLKRKERIGTLSHADATVERNQVNAALLGIIAEL